jgi:hypothetical protein
MEIVKVIALQKQPPWTEKGVLGREDILTWRWSYGEGGWWAEDRSGGGGG